MVKVSRHEVFPEWSAKQLEKLDRIIEEEVASLRERTAGLNNLLTTALRHLGHRCAVDPRGSNGDTWDSLEFAAQVGAAIFAVALAEPGSTVQMELRGAMVPLKASGPAYYTTPENWLTAMWLALVARDEAKIELLSSVPLEVLEASGAADQAYLNDMVVMLQRFNRQEPGVHEALNAALRATDPAGLAPEIRDYVLKIVFPELQLFHHLGELGQEQKFNDALVEALTLHKEYWTATPESSDNPLGYIALGPLALACVARDTGTPIDVESEYLPAKLLDGTWTVEGL